VTQKPTKVVRKEHYEVQLEVRAKLQSELHFDKKSNTTQTGEEILVGQEDEG